MNTLTSKTHFAEVGDCKEVPDDNIRSQVWSILGNLYPQDNKVERRHERRYPYPYLVHLTPVAGDGITPQGESLVVVGKHLSEKGLGFYHRTPIQHRRMIVTLEVVDGKPLAFLIDLNWCRFTKQGWYESGGRLLRTVPCPLEAD
jgi:hypothetical protein